jgi:exonuclease III
MQSVGEKMDLSIAWWNTGMSPPTTKKIVKLNKKTAEGFLIVIKHMLVDGEIDVLGLCEVDETDIQLVGVFLQELGVGNFEVHSLYSSARNRINDFCIIINRDKVEFLDYEHVARVDEVRTYYKAGVKVKLLVGGDSLFNVYLSHWQSRMSMPAKAHRDQLGGTLRSSINSVFEKDGERSHVILMGDFNDDPYEDSMTHHLKSTRDKSFMLENKRVLYNPFWREMGALIPHVYDQEQLWNYPSGTCYFKQKKELTYWKTFDQILFSSSFFGDGRWHFSESSTKIYSLLEFGCYFHDWSHVSDHLPISTKVMRV